MKSDDFQLLIIGLLLCNILAVWLIGETLWREMQRPPRVIRIYEGGRAAEKESTGDHAA
jgi:hypothetical protein